jgi:hypothetical protein
VLSVVARIGHKRSEDTDRAFLAGARQLSANSVLMPARQCDLDELDAATNELATATPKVKQAVVNSLAACIAYDGEVTVNECELLRAVAAALGCPMPAAVARAIPTEEAGNRGCEDSTNAVRATVLNQPAVLVTNPATEEVQSC